MRGTGEYDPYARPAEPTCATPPVPPPNSGYAPQNVPAYGGMAWPPPPRPSQAMAIACLVCGIAGLMCGITGPVAVVLGHLTLRKVKNGTAAGRELAIAGLVIGYVASAFVLVGVLAALA